MSKVYFYSVRDVLTEEETALEQGNAEKEHVSILDCETGRVRKGYAQQGRVGWEQGLNSPGKHSNPQMSFFSLDNSIDV